VPARKKCHYILCGKLARRHARPQAEPAFRPQEGGRRMPACTRSRGRRHFGRVRDGPAGRRHRPVQSPN